MVDMITCSWNLFNPQDSKEIRFILLIVKVPSQTLSEKKKKRKTVLALQKFVHK